VENLRLLARATIVTKRIFTLARAGRTGAEDWCGRRWRHTVLQAARCPASRPVAQLVLKRVRSTRPEPQPMERNMYEQPTESRETESNVQLHAAEVSRVTEVVQVD